MCCTAALLILQLPGRLKEHFNLVHLPTTDRWRSPVGLTIHPDWQEVKIMVFETLIYFIRLRTRNTDQPHSTYTVSPLCVTHVPCDNILVKMVLLPFSHLPFQWFRYSKQPLLVSKLFEMQKGVSKVSCPNAMTENPLLPLYNSCINFNEIKYHSLPITYFHIGTMTG